MLNLRISSLQLFPHKSHPFLRKVDLIHLPTGVQPGTGLHKAAHNLIRPPGTVVEGGFWELILNNLCDLIKGQRQSFLIWMKTIQICR
jgi:hypothetical protein